MSEADHVARLVIAWIAVAVAMAVAAGADAPDRADESAAIAARRAFYRQRHNLKGELDPNRLLEATRAFQTATAPRNGRLQPNAITGSSWVSIGPSNGAGRMTCVAPHPSTANTFLAGAADGGLWKTTDGGATWTPLTDSLPNLSVGAVAYAPSDPTKIYLGTGENTLTSYPDEEQIPGIGLLYSSDGGTTWALPATVIARHFFRISVHPTNPLEVVAATSSGLLRSTNGQNGPWTVVVPHDSFGTTKAYGDFDEVVRDPSTPSVLYAASFDRQAWCDGLVCTNPSNWFSPRVLKSVDGGVTWVEVMNGLPLSTGPYEVGRISLAVARSSPSTVYALVAVINRSGGGPVSRVYKSTNGGSTWNLTGLTLDPLSYSSGYTNTIAVSPTDANRVIAGGVYNVRSTDGGATWSIGARPHPDFHDFQYASNGTLYMAHDGGISVSTDDGATSSDRNAGLITHQFYSLSMDPSHPARLAGGTQDNGAFIRPATGGNIWNVFLGGGDAFDSPFDPTAMQGFATGSSGAIMRTRYEVSGAAMDDVVRNPPWLGEQPGFFTHVVLDPNRPSTIYTNTWRLWKSTLSGDGWTPLPITTTDGSTWDATSGSLIAAIAIAPSDSRTLMVAKADKVFRSTDGGTTWTRTTNGLPVARNVNYLAIDPNAPLIAYAALAGWSSDTIYGTTDGGATWNVRSGSGGGALPPWSAQVVRFDPTDSQTLYAGNDVGLYRSTDGGTSWSRFGSGLPAAAVYDVQMINDGTKLVVATHGRGVWELTVTSPVNQAPVVSASSTPSATSGLVSVSRGATVSFSGTFSDPDADATTAKWVFPDDGTSALATSGGSVSHTFVRAGFVPVTLTATDSRGRAGAATVEVAVAELDDDCATPAVIPAGGPFPFTIEETSEGSTKQLSDPANITLPGCGYNSPYTSSRWISFTPSVSDTYVISLCGSMSTATLVAYTGPACGPYTPVPNSCLARYPDSWADYSIDCNGGSQMTLSLIAGTTYRFAILGTFVRESGPVALTVSRVSTGIPLAVIDAGPAIGPTAGGRTVSITGYLFGNDATVTFGGVPATNVQLLWRSYLLATAPAHAAGNVVIAVTTGGHTATLSSGFTYTTALDISPPAAVNAKATSSTHIAVSWSAVPAADGYEIFRSDSLQNYAFVGTTSGTTFDDVVPAGSAHLYEVRALSGSTASPFTAPDLATAIVFTDPVLTPGTVIKAVHITELRAAVNAVRALATLGDAVFTDDSLPKVAIKAVHVTELRSRLDEARYTVLLPALSYGHTITAGTTTVREMDLTELRSGVR